MRYKDDWDEALSHFEAWWQGEDLGRPALQVTAPKEGVKRREVPAPEELHRRWTDIGYIVERETERIRATYYGGEAFPMMWPNLGPEVTAGYFGCDLVFTETTSWSVPILHDWSDLDRIRFDPDNRWWRLTVAMTEAMVEAGGGDWVVGITDLHMGADTAAAIRDPQKLCLDLVEEPARVKTLLQITQPLFGTVYNHLASIVRPASGGTTSWLPVFSAGRYYPLSNDFSCMVSPVMFREFFLDGIVCDAKLMDHSLYHLDGPDAIKHLDALLEIGEIHGIQWVPGQRDPSPLAWIPLLQRIQRAGRLLDVSLPSEEVLPLMEHLSPRGLMLRTSCRTQSEAEALLSRLG